MLLSFEPFDEICIVAGSRIAALYYTDRVTLVCLHAQSLELTLKHWNRRLIQRRSKLFGNVHATRIAGITSPQEMGEILGKVVHPGPVTRQRMQLLLTFRDRQADRYTQHQYDKHAGSPNRASCNAYSKGKG